MNSKWAVMLGLGLFVLLAGCKSEESGYRGSRRDRGDTDNARTPTTQGVGAEPGAADGQGNAQDQGATTEAAGGQDRGSADRPSRTGDRGAATAGDQATPKAALRKMANAMATFDKERLMATLEPSEAERRVMPLTMDLLKAYQEFKSVTIRSYGQQAWNQNFADNQIEQMQAAFKKAGAEIKRQVDSAEVKIQGNTAEVRTGDDPEPLEMVKVGGDWRAKTDGKFLPISDGDVDRVAKNMTNLTTALHDLTGKAGQSGESAQKLSKELKRAIDANRGVEDGEETSRPADSDDGEGSEE